MSQAIFLYIAWWTNGTERNEKEIEEGGGTIYATDRKDDGSVIIFNDQYISIFARFYV